MTAVGLALLASLMWGTAEFGGGALAMRLPVLRVVFVSQLVGLAGILVGVMLLRSSSVLSESLLWGAGGGLFATATMVMFYQALADGTMGVVAPIAATGAVIPLVAGVLLGDRPGTVQFAGALAALVGVAFSGRHEVRADQSRRRAIGLAIGSAVGMGFVLLLMGRGSATDPVATLLAEHVTVVLLLGCALLAKRSTAAMRRRDVPAVILVGLCDLAGWVAYALASRFGQLGLTAVLASFAALVTTLLATRFLDERLRPLQYVGVALAMCGTALIASG